MNVVILLYFVLDTFLILAQAPGPRQSKIGKYNDGVESEASKFLA